MSNVLKNDDLKIGITIKVNGRETTLEIQSDRPLSIDDYIQQTEISGRFIVVVNGVLLPKSYYATAIIKDGDALDIISPISGG